MTIEIIIEAIKKISKTSPIATLGIVEQVDGNKCKVSREGLPDLMDVRLDTVTGNLEEYFRIIPKKGSQVICLEVEGQSQETCVVKYTEVERIECKIEELEFEMSGEGLKIRRENKDFAETIKDLVDVIAAIVVVQGKGPNLTKLKQVSDDFKTILR